MPAIGNAFLLKTNACSSGLLGCPLSSNRALHQGIFQRFRSQGSTSHLLKGALWGMGPGVHSSESDFAAHQSLSIPVSTGKNEMPRAPCKAWPSTLRGLSIFYLTPSQLRRNSCPPLHPLLSTGLHEPIKPLTLGVGCARLTRVCRSGVADTAASSKPCGSSCVTAVKKAGAGSAAEGKCAAAPFSSLCPRK